MEAVAANDNRGIRRDSRRHGDCRRVESSGMKKKVTLRVFVDDLIKRIDERKTIDCCTEEIKLFAHLVADKIPDETIEIDWKD